MKKGLKIVFILFIIVCFSCKSDTTKPSVTKEVIKTDGEVLAKRHCVRCHSFPEPTVMPKRYWKEVLPFMGFHLGKAPKGKTLSDFRNEVAKKRLDQSGLFPSEAMISDNEWQAIIDFYDKNSPENLPVEQKLSLYPETSVFEYEVLPWKTFGGGLTYLNFSNNIYQVGFNTDKGASYYAKIQKSGAPLKSYQINYPLVDVASIDGVEFLLSMGRIFNIDEPTGSISVLQDSLKPFIEDLQRPVDFILDDLDRDGIVDVLVSEFGKYLGGINIYSNKGQFGKTNLHPKSGAINFVLRDINNDGLKDFYVLVAQEDESIYLFINKGDFKFEKHQLLSLPSYYGTTHFELLDFDNDGDEDIICSSGDSDDFTSALKPYHGIRIFENLGNHKYNQAWFHKQEGAYGTACADYDNDGDIDIASIGYYASLKNKGKEAFLYFENISPSKNKLEFKAYSPLESKDNCFMLIKSKDIDNDGDLDIILGSNSRIFSGKRKGSINDNWQKNGGIITILRNTTK
ncbi:FG-GAP repeat domain-containing protein [Eudoraea chungangensis]|uniref:FG-GAP repeat domain-containing protein n=1 Tax=Eudoraea chungangensis TaxID=1481905 RepID=UPI0023EE20FF|nr:VCBS repeat-containing protein [Eudoraea chungangensis]